LNSIQKQKQEIKGVLVTIAVLGYHENEFCLLQSIPLYKVCKQLEHEELIEDSVLRDTQH